MSDFINKVITVILIFVMLVLAPLLISYMSTDMLTERLVLNDVSQFIDKVTDKFLITEHDINDLYLAVNSHGQAYDITIERYQLLEEPLPDGKTGRIIDYYGMTYFESDDFSSGIKSVYSAIVNEIYLEYGETPDENYTPVMQLAIKDDDSDIGQIIISWIVLIILIVLYMLIFGRRGGLFIFGSPRFFTGGFHGGFHGGFGGSSFGGGFKSGGGFGGGSFSGGGAGRKF